MVKKFKKGDESEECTICMMDYQKKDKITELPCHPSHRFHNECIVDWIKKNNSCPLCKKAITMNDLQEQKKLS